MKVLIIEDEQLAAERLQILLKAYDPDIEVISILESVAESIAWLQKNPVPDVILLDIQLGDGLSFTIFNRLPLKCPVIFTTAFDNYAIEAFQLNSIDYLLKPVTQRDLTRAFNKYKDLNNPLPDTAFFKQLMQTWNAAEKVYKNRFLVKLGNRMFFIEAQEIAYLYAEDKTVFLVNKEGSKFALDFTLEKLEQIIDPFLFFRLNRKIICSSSAIKEIKTYLNSRLKVTLQAGKQQEEAIISREKVQEFKQWAGG